ncbi:MAG TPA: hypothetical protein VKX39_19320 [Bryobacteraceae bacterium]|jgi:hypothetical protein|nr:hypothetical protein [Bryobacteraceae bacterium]
MKGKLVSWLAAAAITAYFLSFAIPALRAGFAPDDPMNAGEYWLRGFWRSAADIVTFWTTAYRPLGAMFYLPIYHFFGFTPLPFRIGALALIAGNIFLTYRVALMLVESRAAAALAAMLATAHASMLAIYYNTSMIYDILAYFFVALMLFLYLRFRRQGELSIPRAALVVCAFIAALDSKELAVVASLWVLAYELLFERPWRLRVPLLLCAISGVYTAGKFLGPNPLAKQEGYRLDLSLHRYLLNNRLYWNDLFYSHWFVTSRRLVFCWLALTALCWIARRLELWWCWVLVTTATLGISFTVQPRGQSGLYLALFAWTMMAASLFAIPFGKRSRIAWPAALVLACVAAWYTVPYWRAQTQAYLDWHKPTMITLAQIKAAPKPPPRSRVLFLHDPWEGYDTLFMALLVWNDHSLNIDLDRKLTPPPDPANYDWVLSFEGSDLRLLKPSVRGGAEAPRGTNPALLRDAMLG